jgi:hypothetical protein
VVRLADGRRRLVVPPREIRAVAAGLHACAETLAGEGAAERPEPRPEPGAGLGHRPRRVQRFVDQPFAPQAVERRVEQQTP